MIFHRHTPEGPLARFVDWFWFYEDHYPVHRQEHVLADGTFELVINLREESRKLFDRERPHHYTSYRQGWISGTHSAYIIIDAVPASSMIGVHFKPGGAAPFLGCPADELRDRVVECDAIWGRSGLDLRERLLAVRGARAKFQLLESYLQERLARSPHGIPAQARITWALSQFLREPQLQTMAAVVDRLGISHKHFIDQFRRAVGLTPKVFCRIQRFQQVISTFTRGRWVNWTDVACDCGYFDQAHLIHDFHAFSGLRPTGYRAQQPDYPNFVPVSNGR